MKHDRLQEVLAKHLKWLSNEEGGERANLRGADLRGADLHGANLRGADLRDTDLRNTNLCGADLYGANLRGANLRGANPRGANLRGANLRGADLYGADLYGADLRDTDLYGANLRGANLRNANLCGADLYGANLRGANLPERTSVVPGEEYFISIENGKSLRAGCQSHSIEEWFGFSKERIAEMDGRRALKFYPRLLDIVDFYVPDHGFQRPEWLAK